MDGSVVVGSASANVDGSEMRSCCGLVSRQSKFNMEVFLGIVSFVLKFDIYVEFFFCEIFHIFFCV